MESMTELIEAINGISTQLALLAFIIAISGLGITIAIVSVGWRK